MTDTWQWWIDNADWLGRATLVHVKLMGATIGIAAVIGIALGALAARVGGVVGFVVMQLANLGRIVPSFALIMLMVPLVGLGFVPALIGLVALAVPPILVNTYVGLTSVDPAVVDAARGMGLTELGILRRVRLPLAVPLVVAGLAVSSVAVVATATISQPVGSGGLGEIVFSGISNLDNATILAGVIPIAALALAVDAVFMLVRRLATPRGLRLPRTP
jgi:osmoprotectant transport system permease protein